VGRLTTRLAGIALIGFGVKLAANNNPLSGMGSPGIQQPIKQKPIKPGNPVHKSGGGKKPSEILHHGHLTHLELRLSPGVNSMSEACG
jgi:hypothetical protein